MDATLQNAISNDYYRQFSSSFSLDLAWSIAWEELAEYPISPVSLSNDNVPTLVKDDVWLLPAEWCPPSKRALCYRKIDFRNAVSLDCAPSRSKHFVETLKRIAVLDRFQTVRAKRKGKQHLIKPPTSLTWVRRWRCTIAVARYLVENSAMTAETAVRSSAVLKLFAGLSPDEMEDLKTRFPTWSNAAVSRLNALFAAGLFDDWPSAYVGVKKFAKRTESRASDHLSDEAFTQIIHCAILLSHMQPELLAAYRRAVIYGQAHSRGKRVSVLQEEQKKVLSSWRSPRLAPEIQFGFTVWVAGEDNVVKPFESWPLPTVRGAKSLLHLCQTANAILLLTTGMRVGELSSLPFDCARIVDGRSFLTGPSFKDNDDGSGVNRHWPLPKVAAHALSSQQELSRAMLDDQQLWVPFGGGKNTTGVPVLDNAISMFAKRVGREAQQKLSEIDGKVTPHRFRYTIARLIALSLTNASQVLFDVLGHDDVDVTLGYAHQDPELAEEIDRIRSEVMVVRAKEIFDNSESNGGPAAGLLRRTKKEMLVRSGKLDLDIDDIAAAASLLGEVEVVRPGVLCTAQKLERGVCSSSLGLRDIGACSTSCGHRLELAACRSDRITKIQHVLRKLNAGALSELEVAFWQNQLVSSLNAFPEILDDRNMAIPLEKELRACDPNIWSNVQEDLKARLGWVKGSSNG